MWINVLINRLLDLWFSISLFLFFCNRIYSHHIPALTLRCYHCSQDCETNSNTMNCSHACSVNYVVSYDNGMKSEYGFKSCADNGECINYSVNLGYAKLAISQECCNSDLCNSGPFPAVDLRPNGKKCYFCVGDNCLGNLQCEGLEDHCLTYIDTLTGHELNIKGCASKILCDFATSGLALTRMNITNRQVTWKCCKGNLCNSAASATLSFFLVLLFLLSSFLLY
ncbi:urokinase plasminogen activator surface receptor-like isoform X1 [Ictalurus furcatus]|uniref:urokinase plasminogen activator surface receptor-like isoform X1 n=2 Tax=Ictalurus furcatus TaxID=66913 RepID=UPI002350BB74|nr:urokinase plasminogen activator surface receptor-like isoform X1 [Ictalurus furcatus]